MTIIITNNNLNVLNALDENQKIIRKLPSQVVVRWSQVVDEWLPADELEEGSDRFEQ